MMPGRVWMEMSGGVDSSVSAAHMLAGGCDVTGITLFPLGEITKDAVRAHAASLGMCRHTVGQRRELGIASAEPLYVTGIDVTPNAVLVGGAQDLKVSRIEASGVCWYAERPTRDAEVRYRHSSPAVKATVPVEGTRLVAVRESTVSGVAPGQSMVCYDNGVVIGGGTIEEAS
ncbi:MAG: aminomethyltransferase beta-barrel domain-containing protein [Coriobacteriia bacterium]